MGCIHLRCLLPPAMCGFETITRYNSMSFERPNSRHAQRHPVRISVFSEAEGSAAFALKREGGKEERETLCTCPETDLMKGASAWLFSTGS